MKSFIIESESLYLTDAETDIGEAQWTEEIDFATPFRTEREAIRAVEKWDDFYGVDLVCRILRHEF